MHACKTMQPAISVRQAHTCCSEVFRTISSCLCAAKLSSASRALSRRAPFSSSCTFLALSSAIATCKRFRRPFWGSTLAKQLLSRGASLQHANHAKLRLKRACRFVPLHCSKSSCCNSSGRYAHAKPGEQVGIKAIVKEQQLVQAPQCLPSPT